MNSDLSGFKSRTVSFALKAAKPGLRELLESGAEAGVEKVFEGVLITASALSENARTIGDGLPTRIKELATNGIYWIIIDDVGLEKIDLPGIEVIPWTGAASTEDVAAHVNKMIDSQGFHVEKILAIGKFHLAGLPTYELMASIRLTTAFVADFEPQDLEERRLVCLPVVAADGQLRRGPTAVGCLLDNLILARRINVRETATLLTSEAIVGDLARATAVARSNLTSACGRLYGEYPHLQGADIYDHHSGAVAFSPIVWRQLLDGDWGGAWPIIAYFSEKLTSYWQPGRPCYKRILYTPTRVLLRGEEYYFHMKNISPIDRVREMLVELGVLRQLTTAFRILTETEPKRVNDRWKIALAFLDQLRNVGLHLFSFIHAADVMLANAMELAGREDETTRSVLTDVRATFTGGGTLHSFVGRVVGAYYYWLLGEAEQCHTFLDAGLGYADKALLLIGPLLAKLESWLTAPIVEDLSKLRIERLVRRWREADHPGENLLVVLSALDEVQNATTIDTVGIGWGGIELPVIFRYLSFLRGIPATHADGVRTYVANWSHYGAGDREPEWVAFPKPQAAHPQFDADVCVLFDDNVLTGETLERLRDEMLLRSAHDIRMYVTRFSGERRLAHMKMENHGAIDPEVLLHQIQGYIGETPFARSWSTKKGDYTNRIGVFSLARRRILECIHNNSTVEAWDREGF